MHHTPPAANDGGTREAALIAAVAALGRALYPHAQLADAPYERTAARVIADASAAPGGFTALAAAIELAERELGPLPTASLEARTAWLTLQAQAPFFELLRSRTCFHLYDDREVWAAIGYPGSSYALGGYLTRGFDQLDWLPTPRVTEHPDPLTEIGPLNHAPDQAEPTAAGATGASPHSVQEAQR